METFEVSMEKISEWFVALIPSLFPPGPMMVRLSLVIDNAALLRKIAP